MKLIEKIINRETIIYGIVGVLTTIINFLSYHILCNILAIPNLTSNAIAWLLAVIFAYIMNDKIVFKSNDPGISNTTGIRNVSSVRNEVLKISKFFGARLISFSIEELGMFIFIDLYGFNNLIVKGSLSVFIIIINYIFSKFFIFN